MATSIEWTDETWNPVVGCDQISPGCANCYAKQLHDKRHKAHLAGKTVAAQYAQPFEVVQLKPERLTVPLSWRKPRRVFVNSVSDLFHEDVPDEFIDKVFAVMALASRHTFQVLTKRADRMRAYMTRLDRDLRLPNTTFPRWRSEAEAILDARKDWKTTVTSEWPLPNVWLGVSVENRKQRDRIIALNDTPAAVRFLSLEPLLEDLELNAAWIFYIDWLIAGGESGRNARPCDLAWLRNIVRLGKGTAKPVFVKQLGKSVRVPREDAIQFAMRGSWTAESAGAPYGIARPFNQKGGDPSEWPEDLRVRQFPGR